MPINYSGFLRGLRRAETWLARLARRRTLSCIVVALLGLALRAALLPVVPIPVPVIQDEFSYVLGGETFAMGRLANPSHQLWPFFETMHVNMHPTYASKYPPAQAVFLALGIGLFGHPWYGVWLSMGLLCGILCWMLQGWIAPKYAVVGGLTAAMQLGVTGYWINSYWGGAVAALGGALVIGALPRLVHSPGLNSAVAAAVGIFILANSRPFEGAILVILLGAALVLRTWHCGRPAELTRPSVVAPVMTGIIVTVGAAAYYNWHVTGDPLVMPYVLNSRQYHWAPPLWAMPLPSPPPRFRDTAMKALWRWDNGIYQMAREHPLSVVRAFSEALYSTFVSGPALPLIFPAFAGMLFVSAPRARIAALILSAFLCLILAERFIMPHYIAPATGLLLICTMFGVQFLRIGKVGTKRIGLPVVAALLLLSGLLFVRRLYSAVLSPGIPEPMRFRARVLEQLRGSQGHHLVLVRYSAEHNFHLEHVYNGPDIDAQKVVWALDRGPAANQRLFDYYAGRTIWLYEPDGPKPTITRWPGTNTTGGEDRR